MEARKRRGGEWKEAKVPDRDDALLESHDSLEKSTDIASNPGDASLGKKSFRARHSLLESTESFSECKSEFKGFFTFFWMGVFVALLTTIFKNYKESGTLFGMKLATLLSKDLLILGLSDLLLVTSSFLAFIIQIAVTKEWLSLRLSVLLKHALQTCMIFGSIFIILKRDWPWLQSGTLLAHSITMYMKVHSYLSTNYELHLQSKTLKDSVYPRNVSLANFIDYLLVPSLVYEPEYPRTDRIRLSYLVEKAVLAFLSIFLLYIVIEHHIMPILEDSINRSLYDSIIHLLLPFMLCCVVLFYVVFQCICNWFAEITRFADREFYSDWWNSVTFDEFARKWNKPVHHFLLRHIYHESIKSYRFSKSSATFLTFFFSSLLHELILAVIGRRILLYMILLQMTQLPLIWLGQTSFFKKFPLAGNVLFWASLTLGLPLITVLYCRDHFLRM